MKPNKHRLNDRFVSDLQQQPKPFLVWDTLQYGLAVQVHIRTPSVETEQDASHLNVWSYFRGPLQAACPVCGTAMIAKCGDIKVRHWAHLGRRTCDHWWEPETVWHRDWKNHFPLSWQERIHSSENGEKHIADVKTGRGVVLEFQHSFLHSNERESREKFYPKLVWVVDALR